VTEASTNPEVRAEVERQMAVLRRGAVDIVSEAELRRKLTRSVATGVPLRVKLGVDPTATMLHLGFTVALGRLRAFQDCGHRAVLIIGDATAMVGDPTGRNATRPQLTREAVESNAASYLEQVVKILDPRTLEVRRNGEWLASLDFFGMIGLLSKRTLAQVFEREDFRNRFRDGTPIHLHELVYPLLQGYDSVVVKADVELGGTEQLFNLMVGRDLQSADGQEPQVCMTLPLLVGLDGSQKMSKSYGNTIGISDAPDDMFGKTMSLPDAQTRAWFTLLTDIPSDEIERLCAGHPRDAKVALARFIVARYHGADAADAAVERFRRVFSNKEVPADLPDVVVPDSLRRAEGRYAVLDLAMLLGHLKSKSDARRLIAQGGLTLNGTKIVDPAGLVVVQTGDVLRAGKLHFGKLVVHD
jgi:tyrosyl-tRNA synthetase